MEHIVFLDRDTMRVPMRSPEFSHTWKDYPRTLPEHTVARLADATIAVTNKVRLHKSELSQLPKLRFIAITATGFDNVDVAFARECGIKVANVAHYARQSVPEHVFMMMLALRRNLLTFRQAIEKGEWQASPDVALVQYPLYDLGGATLGLIGYGELAREVESRAKAFGMKVLIAERKGAATVRPGRAPFERVLAESDIVSVHCPLNAETRDLISAPELQRMKSTALLINTARGAVVDSEALAVALQEGRIAGAGIDVLPEEPPRKGNPLLDLKLPNLLITPHVGWASQQALTVLSEEVMLNLEAFVRGESRNLL
jgi:glycerate dehydrogenase